MRSSSSAHVGAQEDSRREAEPQLVRHRARQRLVRDRLELLVQRGPRATRKHGQHRRRHHPQHPQHLEHGLELLSCTCSPSSSSTLTADLARCEPSKLCSVEPPRRTPVVAGARQRPQHAKCCSAASTRDLPQPPTNTQLLWVGERELVLVDRADTLPTSCRATRADKAVAHSEKACLLDARRRGQRRAAICAAPSRRGGAAVSAATREVDD
jgi:hypothetical protein